MSGRKTRALARVMALFVLLVAWPAGSVPAGAVQPPPGVNQPAPRRERPAAPAAPNISFIDSPAATCERLEPKTNTCLINWPYMSVTASTSQYVITMTVAIDNRMVAVNSGFFQASMYVPSTLYGKGFRVSCGAPGSGGNPDMGGSHSWVLRARETGGLSAANYGTVICPMGTREVYLPVLLRKP